MSIIFALLLGSSLFITSCSGKKWNYDFQTSADALALYQNELKAVRELPSCSTDEFITELQDWQEISDTVFAYIEKDPSFTAHAGLSMDFMAISDNIRTEFYNIATKNNFSLADIAKIKLATSRFDANAQMVAVNDKARVFFQKQDSLKLDKNIKGERLLSFYRNYLNRVKRSGIHSESEMLAFILQEDKLTFSFFILRCFITRDYFSSKRNSNTVRLVCKDKKSISYLSQKRVTKYRII